MVFGLPSGFLAKVAGRLKTQFRRSQKAKIAKTLIVNRPQTTVCRFFTNLDSIPPVQVNSFPAQRHQALAHP
ncbi:cyclase/dehydrase [Neisseria bacilliformis ATCC BAA-1200]|uniref:Cyclase/dehydrase n=1 Tax=Neisseria bacilliformis ATCC BAA-1200 TaxID=888742 RepID=F2BE32_9NEIS|nr:cyclase/dehydrase [Neisseria bacilliformis ATCC BAA-1200]